MRKFFFFFSAFLFITSLLIAQETKQVTYSADVERFDSSIAQNAWRLIGNVVFEHKGALMYCDSAYFYSDSNSLEAFSNVYITQGDTIHLYGDQLFYNGNTGMANIRKNVKLVDKETELTTQALDYNLEDDIGYYLNNGTIVNGENTLKSKEGYYYSNIDYAHFRTDVEITNPDYLILSDTLQYNTVSKIAYFYGPSQIIGDSNYIYCENGWYDTENDIAQFNDNAYLQNKEHSIKGDSLYYDRTMGFGEAFYNVELHDTIQDLTLQGEYAEYYEHTEESLFTGEAVLIQVYKDDSLYLHADTLRSELDSLENKIVKAYYKVKFYRSNMQGKCDSMVYLFSDSTINLYDEPVLWTEDKQITADFMVVHNKDDVVEYMEMLGDAFIVQVQDSTEKNYNQIKGRDMIAHFRDNYIYKVDVNGNAQSIYFAEEDEELISVDISESSDMRIEIEDNQIKRIIKLSSITGTMYPPEQLPEDKRFYPGFDWKIKHRPKNKNEIFIWEED